MNWFVPYRQNEIFAWRGVVTKALEAIIGAVWRRESLNHSFLSNNEELSYETWRHLRWNQY